MVLNEELFGNLVEDISAENFLYKKYRMRWVPSAIEHLQYASEAYLREFFRQCHCLAQHAKRITMLQKDVKVV